MVLQNSIFTSPTWRTFVQDYNLAQEQEKKFEQYLQLLLQENEKYNITAIVDPQIIVADHFYDSLALCKLYNLQTVSTIVDVGSGGGFPGIPLAIVNPHIMFHLVEVNLKKVHFLRLVASQLGLENVEVQVHDWRTFLRTFKKPVDIFIARASLAVEELVRIFKPSLPYQNSIFVYWASCTWKAQGNVADYVKKCVMYTVGQKQRQLCFFSLQDIK